IISSSSGEPCRSCSTQERTLARTPRSMSSSVTASGGSVRISWMERVTRSTIARRFSGSFRGESMFFSAASTTPHHEWPSTTTRGVRSSAAANSMLPTCACRTAWPPTRITKRSPTPCPKTNSGVIRESEQPRMIAIGSCFATSSFRRAGPTRSSDGCLPAANIRLPSRSRASASTAEIIVSDRPRTGSLPPETGAWSFLQEMAQAVLQRVFRAGDEETAGSDHLFQLRRAVAQLLDRGADICPDCRIEKILRDGRGRAIEDFLDRPGELFHAGSQAVRESQRGAHVLEHGVARPAAGGDKAAHEAGPEPLDRGLDGPHAHRRNDVSGAAEHEEVSQPLAENELRGNPRVRAAEHDRDRLLSRKNRLPP